MRKSRQLFTRLLLLAAIFIAKSAQATTYYVDYASGADSNNGTSKGAAWKHAPGMLGLTPSGGSTGDGCASNCASATINPGDSIILKGGTVWPYTVLPWQPNFSGNATTSGTYGCAGSGCITIGYDPTWNQGKVNSVTLMRDLGGCNPASPPTVSFSGGGGSSAAATASVIPSVAGSTEPNVAGFVYYVTVTNQGGGYTSNPSVTISGGGCTGITAVADIYRPVIDAGKSLSIDWEVGYGPGATIWGPGLTPFGGYLIIDHLEIRNILQVARAVNGVPDGVITSFLGNEQGGGGHITYSNNYVHGRFTDCTLNSCNADNQEQADRAIILNNPSDEASGNVVSNGDGYFTGTSANSCGANEPCAFSEHSIYTTYTAGGDVHNNYIYAVRWMTHLGGTGSTPVLVHNNEMWLVIYDVGSAHVNEMYTMETTGSVYNYDNIFHSAVSGASNQQQMGNGTTQYFFNNVSWGLGGGTFNYSVDTATGGGTSGGTFYFYNNTMYANSTATTPCISSGAGSYANYLTVVAQNNYCVSNQQYWLIQGSSPVWQNQAGSTVAANITAASTTQSAAVAAASGHTIANLFAPTSSSSPAVTFASGGTSANLTSLCAGNLVALCADINGIGRPSSGGWQAGAYQYATGNTTQLAPAPLPPTGLVATVQ